MLVLLLGASVLAGCGGGGNDACADGIRETVRLGNIALAADIEWQAAIDGGTADSARLGELRQRADDASDEANRELRLTQTACDFQDRSGRDRPGSEAACTAAVEVWVQAADNLADAQADWTGAVRGWDDSPGDVSAARANVRSDEPDRALARTSEAVSEAYRSLEIGTGPLSTASWAWAACGDSGQVQPCAQAIDVLDKWGREASDAQEAADTKVASYTTPEDDTASVIRDLVRGADELAADAC